MTWPWVFLACRVIAIPYMVAELWDWEWATIHWLWRSLAVMWIVIGILAASETDFRDAEKRRAESIR